MRHLISIAIMVLLSSTFSYSQSIEDCVGAITVSIPMSESYMCLWHMACYLNSTVTYCFDCYNPDKIIYSYFPLPEFGDYLWCIFQNCGWNFDILRPIWDKILNDFNQQQGRCLCNPNDPVPRTLRTLVEQIPTTSIIPGDDCGYCRCWASIDLLCITDETGSRYVPIPGSETVWKKCHDKTGYPFGGNGDPNNVPPNCIAGLCGWE